MAGNKGQMQWMEALKKKYPKYFIKKKVLEIGSAHINGSANFLFTDCSFTGLDVAPASNVHVISIAHKYKCPDNTYDVVFSANALEHDMYWRKTLRKMAKLVKPGGLMWFLVCMNWEEHGTKKTSPEQSLTTQISEEWANYYKNLEVKDIKSALKLNDIFKDYVLEVNPFTNGEVAFWGIKR